MHLGAQKGLRARLPNRDQLRWTRQAPHAATREGRTRHRSPAIKAWWLGNDKLRPVLLAGRQRRRELLPIAVVATLNLDKLLNQRPPSPVEIVQNCLRCASGPRP